MSLKTTFTNYIHDLQDRICGHLEEIDGAAKFKEDKWERIGGGGGRTRVIESGKVFEKGGVNVSVVHGKLNESLRKQLKAEHGQFFACGLSLVIHPESPMIPTVHANVRFFELYNESGETQDGWFGGGMDLTPYYVIPEDAIHFHQTLKKASEPHGKQLYPTFKASCDEYFFNSHRNESRGVGGIFFDYLREGKMGKSASEWLVYTQAIGDSFIPAYAPIVRARVREAYSERQKYWQEIRRGRYVEFNLIHDKGTLFGLRSNGRIESIFMSLPPRVRWDYDFQPEKGSREAQTLQWLQARDWASMSTESKPI